MMKIFSRPAMVAVFATTLARTILMLLLTASILAAAPITYQINITWSDGGTGSGTITWSDSTFTSPTNFTFVTTPGSLLLGATYSEPLLSKLAERGRDRP